MNSSSLFKSARRVTASCLTALLGILALTLPITAHSMIAGKAAFVIGKVEAITADGNRRALSKGSEISSGETISTAAGARAQIRFNDGGFISLQPNSLFRVDEFNYQNKTNGEEKGFFSLLKGGLRAITGVIGRVNRDSYRVATPVATIGVRGTGYSAELSKGLLVNVGEGAISLTNNAGLLVVSTGKAAYVATLNTLPAFTTRQPQNPPQDMDTSTSDEPAEDKPAEDRSAEDRSAEYGPAEDMPAEYEPAEYELAKYGSAEYDLAEYGISEYGLAEFVAPLLYTEADRRNPDGSLTIAPDLVAGVGYDMAYAYMDCGSMPCVPTVGEATGVVPTFKPSGEMIGYVSTTVTGAVGAGTVSFHGTDGGFVSWGRWTGNEIEPTGQFGTPSVNPGVFDYVLAIPTVDMPLSGTATYVLIGSTPPSATDGSTWLLNTSATLNANFLTSTVNVNLSVNDSTATKSYSISSPVTITGTTFSSGTTRLGVTGTTGLCTLSCAASVNGFFAGSNADRAGLAYSINDAGSGSVMPPLTVQGVAAFAAPSPPM